MTFMEEINEVKIEMLENQLRKARQEAQQWEDETCLEIDDLDSIIEGQQEYIKELQAELAELWRHLSGVYDNNRRVCHDWNAALRDAVAARATADNATDAAAARSLNQSLLDTNQSLVNKLEWIKRNTPLYWDMLEEAMTQAADLGVSAPTPPTVSIDWTTAPIWANYHAFDNDGEGWWYEGQPESTDSIWWVTSHTLARQSPYKLPDGPCLTNVPYGAGWKDSITQRPQQGETVPPRPMWSRYRQ